MAGGCSWTKNWLHFDNSYFKRIHGLLDGKSPTVSSNFQSNNHKIVQQISNNERDDDTLLWLATDWALYNSSEFRPHFMKYANDNDLFLYDYADAHKKMSELGAKFDPPEGIKLPFIDISQYINN